MRCAWLLSLLVGCAPPPPAAARNSATAPVVEPEAAPKPAPEPEPPKPRALPTACANAGAGMCTPPADFVEILAEVVARFGHTVQGIEWALEERRRHGKLDANARLLLNGNGEPFDKPTKGGNPNRQIPNRFIRLRQRIADESNAIKKLPFKMLRKTGGDLVKRFSDGEIAGVFLCHGQPVATDNLSDAYTQRPFGKVFTALRKVEEYLAPMFEAVDQHGARRSFDDIKGPAGAMILFYRSADW